MSISFPTSLDTLTNPTSGDKQNSPSHSGQHADANDAIESLEAKVGATRSAVTTSVDYWSRTGWIDPSESWSYASSTTITVPSGAASRYRVCDKIKFTQTTVKYFFVVAVADTVLTVTGGGDYTVANAAISANFYSHAESPVGFPQNSITFSPIGASYAEVTSNQAGMSGTTDLTSLAVTLSVPTGSRLKITGYGTFKGSAINTFGLFEIKEGSTVLNSNYFQDISGNGYSTEVVSIINNVSGAHTYKLTWVQSSGGTMSLIASSTQPSFLIAELV